MNLRESISERDLQENSKEQSLSPVDHLERIFQCLASSHTLFYTQHEELPPFAYFLSHGKEKERIGASVRALISHHVDHIRKVWERQSAYRAKKKNFEVLTIAYDLWRQDFAKLERSTPNSVHRLALKEIGMGVRLWYDARYSILVDEAQYGAYGRGDVREGKAIGAKCEEWQRAVVDKVRKEEVPESYIEILTLLTRFITFEAISQIETRDTMVETTGGVLYNALQFRLKESKLPFFISEGDMRAVLKKILEDIHGVVVKSHEFLYWKETFQKEDGEEVLTFLRSKESELRLMQGDDIFVRKTKSECVKNTQKNVFCVLSEHHYTESTPRILAHVEMLYQEGEKGQTPSIKATVPLGITPEGEVVLARHTLIPLKDILYTAGLSHVYEYIRDLLLGSVEEHASLYEKYTMEQTMRVQQMKQAHGRKILDVVEVPDVDRLRLEEKLEGVKSRYMRDIGMYSADVIRSVLIQLGVDMTQAKGDHEKGKNGSFGKQQRPVTVNDDVEYGKTYIKTVCRNAGIPLEYFMGVLKMQFSSKEILMLREIIAEQKTEA